MIVASRDHVLTLTGSGEVLESPDGIVGIGSGGAFATAAARALVPMDLTAGEIASRAMQIAADMCVFTNHHFVKRALRINESTGKVVVCTDEESPLLPSLGSADPSK